MHRGINQYQQVGTYSSAAYADPYRLVQLLMDGFLDRVAQARGAMERQEIAVKGELISKAISILDGLRSGLDHERGAEIAGNLEELYTYMQRRLVEANAQNEVQYLDEVASLMREIKSAWDAIPPEVRTREAAAAAAARGE
ncbi:flagellar export chaperone FliS [Halorhodospira halophila]|uniref:Flagellar secretion chaperone FliS n=1 Tax=Halorhodospira halophila (strain DSM 244 / SL1) TaxID=349124 RepID=A1WUC8_HALHL|nr:flagellar protein FliS [Halorhodospira halophila SL1]MBK1729128.1 flagella export chaperone FliS [Halorhodospira halophila]